MQFFSFTDRHSLLKYALHRRKSVVSGMIMGPEVDVLQGSADVERQCCATVRACGRKIPGPENLK